MAKNLSPANEARLRAAIGERGLQAAAEVIVASSVECATLYTLGPEDYAQVGNSRYGGVPDLPDEKLWPQTDEGKFYQFFTQVNLADVPDFTGNVLPQRGMLYAFLADYEDIAKDWAIIWANVPPSDLRRMEPKPSEQISDWCQDEISYLPPYQIMVQPGVDVPLWFSEIYHTIEQNVTDSMDESVPKRGRGGRGDLFDQMYSGLSLTMQNIDKSQNVVAKLIGHPFYIGYDPHEEGQEDETVPPSDFVLFLSMFSVYRDRIFDVCFGDAGYVQIFIDPAALAAHDFSSVVARMESS